VIINPPTGGRRSTRSQSAAACRRTVAFLASRRARFVERRDRLSLNRECRSSLIALAEFANLPLYERVNDRLSVAMIAIDEAVQMCEMEGDTTHQASWLTVQTLAAYDQVNCIMKAISD
jgi:hypothetical protein